MLINANEELTDALNELCFSKSWRFSLETIQSYVDDPEKELPPRMMMRNKKLIEFGRNNPATFARLVKLIHQIHYGRSELVYYTEERSARLQEAVRALMKVQRPKRLIEKIKAYAETDQDWNLCFWKKDQKIFNELVALYRSNPREFDITLDIVEYDRQKKTRAKDTERNNKSIARKEAIRTIIRFKYPKKEEEARYKEAVNSIHLQRDSYIEKRLDKMPYFEARKEFYALYDKELLKTAELVRASEKGMAIRKDLIDFPILDSAESSEIRKASASKIGALESKWSHKKHGRTRS